RGRKCTQGAPWEPGGKGGRARGEPLAPHTNTDQGTHHATHQPQRRPPAREARRRAVPFELPSRRPDRRPARHKLSGRLLQVSPVLRAGLQEGNVALPGVWSPRRCPRPGPAELAPHKGRGGREALPAGRRSHPNVSAPTNFPTQHALASKVVAVAFAGTVTATARASRSAATRASIHWRDCCWASPAVQACNSAR